MASDKLPTVEAEFRRFMRFLASSTSSYAPMLDRPLTYDEVDAIDVWLVQVCREQARLFCAIGRLQYPGT